MSRKTTTMPQTLWDFVEKVSPFTRPSSQPLTSTKVIENQPEPLIEPAPVDTNSIPDLSHLPMKDRYDAVVAHTKKRFGIRIRKWRSSMSGVAWQITYTDGSTARLIESPRPRGPMSAAVYLHEVGHHAIGFKTYKPRCLEEYMAWQWSLLAMEQYQLNITPAVRRRMHLSIWYAVEKARRRGLKKLPAVLLPYLHRPAKG